MSSKPTNRFHRHSLGEVLTRSVELFCQEWLSYLFLTAVMVIPTILIRFLLSDQLEEFVSTDVSTEDSVDALMPLLGAGLIYLIFMLVIGVIVKGAMIRSTVQAFLPTKVTVSKNLRHGLERFGQILCLWLYYIIGFVLFLVPFALITGALFAVAEMVLSHDAQARFQVAFHMVTLCLIMYISLALNFCVPTIVVERISAFQSLDRAWKMARGHRCMIFFALLALFGAIMVVACMAALLFSGSAFFVVNAFTSLVIPPLTNILITVLYLNVRIDKEGLNAEVLAGELGKGDAKLGLSAKTEGRTDVTYQLVASEEDANVTMV